MGNYSETSRISFPKEYTATATNADLPLLQVEMIRLTRRFVQLSAKSRRFQAFFGLGKGLLTIR